MEKVYETALADPDSLVNVADRENDQYECEDILYVAIRAYEEVAGKQLFLLLGNGQPPELAGANWDFDDQDATARQLPRLARKYD